MDAGNPLIWLVWTGFGGYLLWLAWTRYRPAVLQAPPLPREAPRAIPAWLFCEDGPALDRRVQWFPLRPGGRTVAGRRPRADTEETHFLYLTADDLAEDHVLIACSPQSGRYTVEALSGAVHHNNEPLAPGQPAELADGDTLDLGSLSRFRFTLTGPEES